MIDSDGTQVGIVSLNEALDLAAERKLDLVKIAPKAKPPVCKILDYGKYRYELQKKEKEARKKQKTMQVKEIRLKMCIRDSYKDSERMIVVDMLPEDVLEIRPEGNRQWAKTAFNIGNMHHPAYLYDDCIRIPYDGILENLMKSIGVAYTRCERKLDGEKAAQTVGNLSLIHI